MSSSNNIIPKFALVACTLLSTQATTHGQETVRPRPTWWFGFSGAANVNTYDGKTQMLNSSRTTPTPFHKGTSVKPYLSLLTEYRPGKVFGGMLNIAYDNRGGKFDDVIAPCDCPATLQTNLSYFNIEPALRIAPFGSSFYLFAGPVIGFNVAKSFSYTQEKQADLKGEWSDVRKTVLAAQAGAGIDLPISRKSSSTQVTLSPFVSFQSNIGRDPRSVESWSTNTFRGGIALKFGKVKKDVKDKPEPETAPIAASPAEVQFSVRAPLSVPSNRPVKETFPLINGVFFDKGSLEIPARYVRLTPQDAASFREEGLQESQPEDLTSGRSSRQMAVYHNVLNIVGDRMRSHPTSTISLRGTSETNAGDAKRMAENIRTYLGNSFGIDASRITVDGKKASVISTRKALDKTEMGLLTETDRMVKISSPSSDLLLQVGGASSAWMKPVEIKAVQADPVDSHVIFTAGGADSLLSSWTLQVTDDKGTTQNFGPFTSDQTSVSGKSILGNDANGDYKILLTGTTKDGRTITRESSLRLVKATENGQQGLRYSVLFDFDKASTVEGYHKFLEEVVSPLIVANDRVVIHGHTDVVGNGNYNLALSNERAAGTQKVIEAALLKKGITGVKFDTYGFGKDAAMSPFANNLPEELYYNRTVIIDIVPEKK
ncbi:OmpA family protein [Flavitalea antarctica]